MKIILSTDFSAENEMLYPYAIDLLKVTGGQIILFHAFMDHILMGDSSFPGGIDSDTFFNRSLLIEMEQQSASFLKEKQALLETAINNEQLNHINITSVLKGGDPEQELIQLTDAEAPDLILMGTKGKGGKGFLEGSMAKSLMTKVSVPVLAIPENYQWTPSSQIMYATNFGKFEITTINQIFKLLIKYRPLVYVVHFVTDSSDNTASTLMDELRQAFKNEEAHNQIRFELVNTSNPRDAMKVFCESNQISLAAFIAHKRKWLDYIFKDKVGKDDFFNLGIPMLTFRVQ